MKKNFEVCRGALETGISWIGDPNSMLIAALKRIKYGRPIDTDDEELRTACADTYLDITWNLNVDQILVVEDTHQFSPNLMSMVIRHVQTEWAKKSGLWLPTPDMVWWYPGQGVRFEQHRHANAAECRKAKALHTK